MLPNSRYDIWFLCLLIKNLKTPEVGEILLFVSRLREGDRDMFSGNPFVKIVFNLDSEFFSCDEESKHRDLQLSRQMQWLSTRAFCPRKTQGVSPHRPSFLGTTSCWWAFGGLVEGISQFSAPGSTCRGQGWECTPLQAINWTCLIYISSLIKELLYLVVNCAFWSWCIQGKRRDHIWFRNGFCMPSSLCGMVRNDFEDLVI